MGLLKSFPCQTGFCTVSGKDMHSANFSPFLSYHIQIYDGADNFYSKKEDKKYICHKVFNQIKIKL